MVMHSQIDNNNSKINLRRLPSLTKPIHMYIQSADSVNSGTDCQSPLFAKLPHCEIHPNLKMHNSLKEINLGSANRLCQCLKGKNTFPAKVNDHYLYVIRKNPLLSAFP